MIHRCPTCHSRDHLWREVEVTCTGWQDLNDRLEVEGNRDIDPVDWLDVDPTGTYGCSECDWGGRKDQLEELGIDGEPLPSIHRDQLQIEVVA